MEFQRLKKERESNAGPGHPVYEKRRLSELETSLAVALIKVNNAEGRVKNLDVVRQGSELQQA